MAWKGETKRVVVEENNTAGGRKEAEDRRMLEAIRMGKDDGRWCRRRDVEEKGSYVEGRRADGCRR